MTSWISQLAWPLDWWLPIQSSQQLMQWPFCISLCWFKWQIIWRQLIEEYFHIFIQVIWWALLSMDWISLLRCLMDVVSRTCWTLLQLSSWLVIWRAWALWPALLNQRASVLWKKVCYILVPSLIWTEYMLNGTDRPTRNLNRSFHSANCRIGMRRFASVCSGHGFRIMNPINRLSSSRLSTEPEWSLKYLSSS